MIFHVASDGAVPAVWNDPQVRVRDGRAHFYRDVNRVERVTVSAHNESSRGDRFEVGAREIHVKVAVLEAIPLRPQSPNLLVAILVTLAHELPFFGGHIVNR